MFSLVLKLTKTNPPAGVLQRHQSKGQHIKPRGESLAKEKNICSKVKYTYTGWWFSCAAQHIPYSLSFSTMTNNALKFRTKMVYLLNTPVTNLAFFKDTMRNFQHLFMFATIFASFFCEYTCHFRKQFSKLIAAKIRKQNFSFQPYLRCSFSFTAVGFAFVSCLTYTVHM
jgi:hypothetical protein